MGAEEAKSIIVTLFIITTIIFTTTIIIITIILVVVRIYTTILIIIRKRMTRHGYELILHFCLLATHFPVGSNHSKSFKGVDHSHDKYNHHNHHHPHHHHHHHHHYHHHHSHNHYCRLATHFLKPSRWQSLKGVDHIAAGDNSQYQPWLKNICSSFFGDGGGAVA